MNPPSIAQDLALKKRSVTPPDQKPNYNWRDILGGEDVAVPEIQVLCPHGEERFDLSEVADTVLFLQRLLLHYGIYRRYPLKPWPAFKNAWRIAFR